MSYAAGPDADPVPDAARGVIATLDDKNPANRTALVMARIGLGRVMVHGGEAREAIPVIETAVASARVHLAASVVRFVHALVALGQALTAAGEQDRARGVLHEAVAANEALPAPSERLRAAAQKALADVQGGAR